MLTLGLPTSATAAIMLSAFQSYGINPGPLLFESQPQLVWGLIASLFIGNVMLLVLNLPMIAIWVKLLQIPAPLLYAGILVFATIGTYGITQSPVDLILLYLCRRHRLPDAALRLPAAPVIIGMILGPLAEQNFRQAMTISPATGPCCSRGHCRRRSSPPRRSALIGPKLYQLATGPSPSAFRGTRVTKTTMRAARDARGRLPDVDRHHPGAEARLDRRAGRGQGPAAWCPISAMCWPIGPGGFRTCRCRSCRRSSGSIRPGWWSRSARKSST
jgi:hypothetical protein